MRPAGALGLSTDEIRTWAAECRARVLLLRKEDLGRLMSKDKINLEYSPINYEFIGTIYSLCIS